MKGEKKEISTSQSKSSLFPFLLFSPPRRHLCFSPSFFLSKPRKNKKHLFNSSFPLSKSRIPSHSIQFLSIPISNPFYLFIFRVFRVYTYTWIDTDTQPPVFFSRQLGFFKDLVCFLLSPFPCPVSSFLARPPFNSPSHFLFPEKSPQHI